MTKVFLNLGLKSFVIRSCMFVRSGDINGIELLLDLESYEYSYLPRGSKGIHYIYYYVSVYILTAILYRDIVTSSPFKPEMIYTRDANPCILRKWISCSTAYFLIE